MTLFLAKAYGITVARVHRLLKLVGTIATMTGFENRVSSLSALLRIEAKTIQAHLTKSASLKRPSLPGRHWPKI